MLLLAGVRAFAFDLGEQVAVVGDLVDHVIKQVGEVFRGKRPRRRRSDERLPAWCG